VHRVAVKAWNGDSIFYYPEGADFNCDTFSLSDFLQQRAGKCNAFVGLFDHSLAINNLTDKFVEVKTKDDSLFMVKNWSAKKQSFPEENRFEFYLTYEGGVDYGMVPPPKSYGDLVNEVGLPGQNTPTPSEKVFPDHFINDLSSVSGLKGDRYYDPSYGVTFKDADDFERKAVYGYAYASEEDESADKEIRRYKVQQVIPSLYPRNIEFIHE
jgi:hypothetical protein